MTDERFNELKSKYEYLVTYIMAGVQYPDLRKNEVYWDRVIAATEVACPGMSEFVEEYLRRSQRTHPEN